MARKTDVVTIDTEGRDRGKMFLITEMPATQAEAWATRALLALTRAGVDVPEDLLDRGMAGMAVIGLRALGNLAWEEVKPLMDEMFSCVQCIPNSAAPNVVRFLLEDDIEEIATRLTLRERVLSLHMGFSIAGALSKYRQSLPATATETTSNIETSPAPSAG